MSNELSKRLSVWIEQSKFTVTEVAKRSGYPETQLRNHLSRGKFRRELLPRLLEVLRDSVNTVPTLSELENNVEVDWIDERLSVARTMGQAKIPAEYGLDLHDRPREMWIFAPEPYELRDPGGFGIKMKPLLADKDLAIIYFVPNLQTAQDLVQTINWIETKSKNVLVVIMPTVSILPHWTAFFYGQDDGTIYFKAFAESDEIGRFVRIAESAVRRIMITFTKMNTLNSDFPLFQPKSNAISKEGGAVEITCFWGKNSFVEELQNEFKG